MTTLAVLVVNVVLTQFKLDEVSVMRRILVALRDVPLFDVFRHEDRMYRRQRSSGDNKITHGLVLVTPMYRDHGDTGHAARLLRQDTQVEWVR